MRKSHLVYISVTLADSLSKCPVVQLLQSMFEMSALCAITTYSQACRRFLACVDSSVNNVLAPECQTNPDFNRLLPEFIHILERRLIAIDLLLHDPQSL